MGEAMSTDVIGSRNSGTPATRPVHKDAERRYEQYFFREWQF
jgi:hypothetical protein